MGRRSENQIYLSNSVEQNFQTTNKNRNLRTPLLNSNFPIRYQENKNQKRFE
jgi:hypothetical protein